MTVFFVVGGAWIICVIIIVMATAWSRVLSASNRSRVMAELGKRSQGLDYSGMGKLKQNAVLVPLLAGPREPELLFTVRSRELRQHRGQVR